MFIKKKYSVWQMFWLTRVETFIFFLIALIPAILFVIFDWAFLQVPWTPIALIGTAVAFLIGFQNNAAYGRIWEARKIWGGVVNSSRSWVMMIKDMITNERVKEPLPRNEVDEIIRRMVYRHIGWMTALRHAMRQTKPWEVFLHSKSNREWAEMMHIPEQEISLSDDLRTVLSEEDHSYVMSKTNKAAALLSLQSKDLREQKEKGLIWEFAFFELEGILVELFNLQGKSERIKNFPYPRQYATLSYDFVWVFILMLPFGTVPEFQKIGMSLAEHYPFAGKYFVWLSVPFVAAVSWVFHTMQRIGTVGENPFEGSANDVPISTIARGIEIDLREMIDEDSSKIPAPLEPVYDVYIPVKLTHPFLSKLTTAK